MNPIVYKSVSNMDPIKVLLILLVVPVVLYLVYTIITKVVNTISKPFDAAGNLTTSTIEGVNYLVSGKVLTDAYAGISSLFSSSQTQNTGIPRFQGIFAKSLKNLPHNYRSGVSLVNSRIRPYVVVSDEQLWDLLRSDASLGEHRQVFLNYFS